MDGFAVVARDTFAAASDGSIVLDITGEVTMGSPATEPAQPGGAQRVATGAMMPPGADAVVIVENTEELPDGRVLVRQAAVAGQNTIRIGEDLCEGDLVFSPGRRLKGADIGALVIAGHTSAVVHRRPHVGLIVTGDEIIGPGITLQPGQVRNVNEYVLGALAAQCNAVVNDYGVVGDDEQTMNATLARAVDENDAVFISGGSSKGTKDFTRRAIESLDGSEIVFHGVAIAPGKPTILARAGKKAIMGLPGNPAAVAVVFHLFGSVLVRRMGGENLTKLLSTRPAVRAIVSEDVKSTQGRDDFVRVSLDEGEDMPTASPILGKSVSISTLARADGLMRIDKSCDLLAAGTIVDVALL